MSDSLQTARPNGYCPAGHGPLFSRNGIPFCLTCDSIASRKVVKEEEESIDPGELYFETKVAPEEKPLPRVISSLPDIVARLKALPMPSNIGQYKAIQRTITTLERIIKETE